MAAFSSAAFSVSAFSPSAFSFDVVRSETYSGGWFDYPDRPRRKIEEAAREVIAEIRALPVDVESIKAESAELSRQIASYVADLERVAQNRRERIARAKEAGEARKLRDELAAALVLAEQAQQQRDELDVVWVTMMIAAQL